ncbi:MULTISPECIES: RdgB/HAM1 family non-canonical purine NTP pyrophosphatase [unclassified Pseudoalteromonas]|uniref:RdgB/HAM1 family non-canonical purine NTP pyrophosphatase n=1 Tax=unclassified Pseudoalteromonas TaxID=194690 RepID=UPI000CF6531A|nr:MULTISPECIES: RdgB/HAM1 family non-canonical purine NTP pyrophosphatase [unclassified Pseudoalteromonas]
MTTWVLATGNKGKVAELSALLSDLHITIKPQSDFDVSDVAETGTTFVENAIIKARHASAQTGLPAIADDSGLIVDALDGAPGVYSARYGGPGASDGDNIDKLLLDMQGLTKRSARFCCVLVLMRHKDDPLPLICQATWEGEITEQRSGFEGFGYDPVFKVKGLNKTSAELTKAEKNAISHRGQALQLLLAQLQG